MTWPAAPEVANAYIDQLLRANKINKNVGPRLKQLPTQFLTARNPGAANTLARKLERVNISPNDASINPQTPNRLNKLHAPLKGIPKDLKN